MPGKVHVSQHYSKRYYLLFWIHVCRVIQPGTVLTHNQHDKHASGPAFDCCRATTQLPDQLLKDRDTD